MAAQQRRLTALGPADAAEGLSVAQRRARLDERIAWLVERTTCTVRARGELHAVVALSAPPPERIGRVAASVVSAGVWALIWLVVVRQPRPLEVLLSVDEGGVVAGTAWM